jgi:hypothetical protein
MKTKTIIGIVVLLVIGAHLGNSAWSSNKQLVATVSQPLTAITQVRIHGAASVVHLSTRAEAPWGAQLYTHRAGWGGFWRSAWATGGCGDKGTLDVVGSTLHVNLPGNESVWGGWGHWGEPDCTLELQVQLPAGVRVDVDQQASRLTMDGDFSTVSIQSRAGDVALRGHASALSVSGDALRARIDYTRVQHDETLAFQGQAMDLDLRMPPATPIHYLVEAHASLVNSSLPNTPGAMPSITVRGDMVRATIR